MYSSDLKSPKRLPALWSWCLQSTSMSGRLNFHQTRGSCSLNKLERLIKQLKEEFGSLNRLLKDRFIRLIRRLKEKLASLIKLLNKQLSSFMMLLMKELVKQKMSLNKKIGVVCVQLTKFFAAVKEIFLLISHKNLLSLVLKESYTMRCVWKAPLSAHQCSAYLTMTCNVV